MEEIEIVETAVQGANTTNFQAIQRKRTLLVALSCALLGVSCALFVVGALLLVLKLCGVPFAWYLYLVIGIGLFLAVGGALLALRFPTKKRLARYLDERYALGEKAQTMVEFADREGGMLEYQREHTERALTALPRKNPKLSYVLTHTLLPLFTAGVFVAGLLVPAKVIPLPPSEGELPFDFTKIQKQRLETLIRNVSSSELTEELKTGYLEQLNGLLDGLNEGKSNNQMKTSVRTVMLRVIESTLAHNTYDDFVAALQEESLPEELSSSLTGSSVAHVALGVKILDYNAVKDARQEIDGYVGELLADASVKLHESVQAEISGEGKTWADYQTGMASYVDSLTRVASTANVVETDALRAAFVSLNGGFVEWGAKEESSYTVEAILGELEKACKAYASSATTALNVQSYSCMIEEHVLRTLSDIFAVAVPTTEGEEDSEVGAPSDDPSHGGGGGSGGTDYPSDDTVYDPDTNSYRPYHEILEERKKYFEDLLARDDLPAELRLHIQSYLDALLGGNGGTQNQE